MDGLVLVGVIGALLAAVGQASSYLVSRHYLSQDGRSPIDLLIMSNVWMGLFALPVMLLTWRTPDQGWGVFLTGMAFQTIGYIAAQGIFFWTVRFVAASRIAPLLGIKIVFVALLALVFGNAELGPWQWVAVGLCVVAAVAIQRAAEPVPLKGLLGILATGAFFACSDNGIALMGRSLGGTAGDFSAPFFVLGLSHAAFLPIAALASLHLGLPSRLPWRASLPYAGVWFFSMISLFTGIHFAGVVLAIICQAMRGPLSLVIALVVARCGWHHLEVPQRRAEFIKQVLAAVLMCIAIGLYVAC